MIKSNVVWIDENIDSEEYKKFTEELKSFSKLFFNVRLLKNVDEAIERMKYILFEETKIIISDNLYPEFIKQFNDNINNMCFAPKIIIFTRNKQKFLKYNHDFEKIENKFCVFGGIATKFDEIKDFLNKENENIINNEIIFNTPKSQNDLGDASIPIIDSNEQLTFEYIDSK